MIKFTHVLIAILLSACGAGDDFDIENPFEDTLPEVGDSQKEVVTETIICRQVIKNPAAQVSFDTLVGNRDESFFHYYIDYTAGLLKLNLSSPKRWNRRSVSIVVDAVLDAEVLKFSHAASIIETTKIWGDDDSGFEIFLEPLDKESRYFVIKLINQKQRLEFTLSFLEFNGRGFIDRAELKVKQAIGKHTEKFTNTLVEFINPYVDAESKDIEYEFEEVCEKKVEQTKEPAEDVESLRPNVGALNGNKLKARFFYKVDPVGGSIDAVTKIPNVPLYGKYQDKRHFVVDDPKILLTQNLREMNLGEAFALDTVDDWTARVKSRNDDAESLILDIHNKSEKVKLELEIPYDNKVAKFAKGKFKINRGIIKLSIDFD